MIVVRDKPIKTAKKEMLFNAVSLIRLKERRRKKGKFSVSLGWDLIQG